MTLSKLKSKLSFFKNSTKEQKDFKKHVLQLPLMYILWPHFHAKHFHTRYCVSYAARHSVFPLGPIKDRLYYVKMKLEKLALFQYTETHPTLIYFMLSCFQHQFCELFKNYKPKRKVKSLSQELEQMKLSLGVSLRLRGANGAYNVSIAFLQEFQDMARSYISSLKKNAVIENELVALRSVTDQKQNRDLEFKKLKDFNHKLRLSLRQERKLSSRLEKELRRVTETILSSYNIDKNSSLFDEYQNLRQEYDLLARKNDALVSKNIELGNSVEKSSRDHVSLLEGVLDGIQSRINILLKNEYTDDYGVLLSSIEKEIGVLIRSRTYLGRSLYNIGLLYFRMGEKNKAVTEFRAAKELGISDKKSENIMTGVV